MSAESLIVIGVGIVVAIMGWLLVRAIGHVDKAIDELKADVGAVSTKVEALTTRDSERTAREAANHVRLAGHDKDIGKLQMRVDELRELRVFVKDVRNYLSARRRGFKPRGIDRDSEHHDDPDDDGEADS